MAATEPLVQLSGRYQLGSRLGQGGMAEVYAAEDLRLGREVAIKMLRAHLAADEVVKSRFELEARTAARLSHPNVVSIFDTAEEQDVAYIVMERLPGTTLSDELKAGTMSSERARDVAVQVLSALGAAHRVGIVHRDIKPANVLTCPDERVKVADFGIATAMDEAQHITSTGILLGTPAYLAPERLSGAEATASSDLYAVGALLYVALTGRQPFEGRNTLALITAIRDEHPVPLASLRPDVDSDLARLVEVAMSKDPKDRPASAEAMAAMLGAATTRTRPIQLPSGDTDEIPLPEPRRRFAGLRDWLAPIASRLAELTRAHRIVVTFLAAVLLALVIALPLAATSPSNGPSPNQGPSTGQRPNYPSLVHAPAPLSRAMHRLETVVG